MNDGLTLDKLEKTWDALCPKLYYATHENIEPGRIIISKATPYTPEFFVCHPDDFEIFKKEGIVGRRLVHLRDYEPSKEELERIKQRFAELIGNMPEEQLANLIGAILETNQKK